VSAVIPAHLLSLLDVSYGPASARVLERVTLRVAAGEIVGLCADPGPSRGALVDLITGARDSRRYEGELHYAGIVRRFRRTEDAHREGIAHLARVPSSVPELSVAENLMLGREPKRFGLVDEALLEAEARTLSARFGVTEWLDLLKPMALLPVGLKQIVEIIRRVSQGAKLLVLEDVTLPLSQSERERLFTWVRRLAGMGVGILFVSQRIDEVFGVCDRVVVLRSGRTAEAHGTPAQRRPLLGGRYTIGEEVASGGMATVHLGRASGAFGFEKTVAVKRLFPQLSRDPEFVAMFLDEARLAAHVRHPNVVPVLDVFADAGEICLVMEYVEGESLAGLWRALGSQPVPLSIAVGVVVSVLHGLEAAHCARNERGEPLSLVHRDVSPQNVLVGVDGVTRLIDFGVAKALGRASVSREGQLKGKIPYMAPEQLSGRQVTALTDLWGAGVVLWELLTGERLFEGETEGMILGRVLDEQVPPPSELRPEVPRALDAAVLRALERTPNARFPSARDMARALEAAVQPATADEIGAWVERTAQAELARRRQRVQRAFS
jgi:ABC-type branched-subunit amino acid transport system ATPase component